MPFMKPWIIARRHVGGTTSVQRITQVFFFFFYKQINKSPRRTTFRHSVPVKLIRERTHARARPTSHITSAPRRTLPGAFMHRTRPSPTRRVRLSIRVITIVVPQILYYTLLRVCRDEMTMSATRTCHDFILYRRVYGPEIAILRRRSVPDRFARAFRNGPRPRPRPRGDGGQGLRFYYFIGVTTTRWYTGIGGLRDLTSAGAAYQSMYLRRLYILFCSYK